MRLHESVKHLVKSFDDDQGLPQSAYIATACIINSMWGIKAEQVFQRYVDSTDERFHLKDGTADDCLRDMLMAAGLTCT